MKNSKKFNQGITLIALVVTIVVLLILAGITITFVLGENGIINMAQRAADATNKAVEKEQENLKNITDQMQDYLNGNSSGNIGTKVSDLIGKPADPNKNIGAKDEYGNKITIPAGFTVVPHSDAKPTDKTEEEWNAEKVEYNYREDHKPCVQDGIVVQDGEGNQFVWIPVGEITNKDGTKTTIDLARYTFDVTADQDTGEILGTGAVKTKTLDGSAVTDEFVDKIVGTHVDFIEELPSSTTYGNSKAKDIEGFKINGKTKGGYYLARYEASPSPNGEKPMSKANQLTWGNITQPNASSAAQAMYINTNYTSDLVNSYAWDTAIVFIQTYGGEENRTYSMHAPKIEEFTKTGMGGDKVCNIYDMASILMEWTTETARMTNSSCTPRGSFYIDSTSSPSRRIINNTSNDYGYFSFRTIIYIQ